jgi:major vault protein
MRVIMGPDLAELGYDEEFTLTYLSGKTPKKPGCVKTLYLMLGPVFSTDIVDVETSDHARLEMKLAFYWRFLVNPKNAYLVFNVRDFVGDMCKAMGSKIRSMVAGVPFDVFHKNSAECVRKSIFGKDSKLEDETNSVLNEANRLEVFGVDIQSIEPKDKGTKESLDKTVTQAIQITTKMQEQEARRAADKVEQEEQAKIERIKIEGLTLVEDAKKQLLELKSQSEGIQTKGQAIAEAQAISSAAAITAQSDVKAAELKANALQIKETEEIEYGKKKNQIEYEHKKALDSMKIQKARQLGAIQGEKFQKIMDAIGKETLITIAMAGPETQAKMLSSLGLKGYMLMGSKNPINLFTAANGMIGNKDQKPPTAP